MLRRVLRLAPGAALPFLLACGESATEEHWIDQLIEETSEQARAAQGAAPATAAATAPPASDWNELPLADGVFADRTDGGTAYRRDVIEIPVSANGGALEYKLQMNAGDSIVYSWTAEGLSDPSLLLSEFHGHTERVGDAPGDLMFYRREPGAAEAGAMTAPFTGIHGWYLENNSGDDITVVLDVAGFYEVVPGQAGTPRQ